MSARAKCASGTLVLTLLCLAVPLEEIAAACGIPVTVLRSTIGSPKSRGVVADPIGDAAFARLNALIGVVVTRGLPGARALAEADAIELGCVIDDA